MINITMTGEDYEDLVRAKLEARFANERLIDEKYQLQAKLGVYERNRFSPKEKETEVRALLQLLSTYTAVVDRIKLIKAARALTDLGLKEAKDLVEEYFPPKPQLVKNEIPLDVATRVLNGE